jgi:hypothetical protein
LRVGDTQLIVPGSTKNQCSACGRAVWVSRASLALSKEKNLQIICMPCAEERAAKDDDVRVQPPTKEQRDEIKDMIERG